MILLLPSFKRFKLQVVFGSAEAVCTHLLIYLQYTRRNGNGTENLGVERLASLMFGGAGQG